MGGLLIKNLPQDLHARLKAQAAANRRSLSSEAIILLERGPADRAGPLPLEEMDRLRVQGARPLTQELQDEARGMGRP